MTRHLPHDQFGDPVTVPDSTSKLDNTTPELKFTVAPAICDHRASS